GEVLVMDWGVARLAGLAGEAPEPASVPARSDTTAEATAHGTVLGTPGFMAPEQERGELDRVGVRSDVYALGAVLGTLLDAHAARTGERIPRPLEAVRRTAMDAEPERRYPGAAGLAADVSRWLDRLPVAAYREGPLERARRIFLRYQTPILLVLAYLLMRVVLLLVG
ncbi:MAG TPA: hypothetical protein VEW03_10290, partial [Longimicrobiaceae bacterium]|nr:hypothetical protein [Longimicrobiaceae bacterium]